MRQRPSEVERAEFRCETSCLCSSSRRTLFAHVLEDLEQVEVGAGDDLLEDRVLLGPEHEFVDELRDALLGLGAHEHHLADVGVLPVCVCDVV